MVTKSVSLRENSGKSARAKKAEPVVSKRLSKTERRDQLLEVARTIVREEGTDAVTLAYVADRAGVTKPIAYEHFETRAGLLIALARWLDDVQVKLFIDELKRTRARLPDVARAASTAYMRCVAACGPEWQAITAALKGDEVMTRVQQEILDRYVRIYFDALAPYTRLSKRELETRCTAIIGAAEALARDMSLKRMDEKAAAATLGSLILSWISA